MAGDYYEILGVSRSADKEEIKRAYRRLARKYHPDVNKTDGAEERFKEINRAYEVLSEPETRARYDRFGEAGVSGWHNCLRPWQARAGRRGREFRPQPQYP